MIYFVSNQSDAFEYLSIKKASISNFIEWAQDKTVFAVDTETEGLNYLTKKVIMLQIGDDKDQWVIDTRGVDLSPIKFIFESPEYLKIFHNVKFDVKFLRSSFGFITQNVYDTMLVEQVIYGGIENYGFSLANLVKRYLGADLDKSVRNQFVNLKGTPYTATQIIYGARDVEYLIKIREKQIEKYKDEEFASVVDLENEVSLAFADIEYNGIGFDPEAWKKLSVQAVEEAHIQAEVLDQHVLRSKKLERFVAKYFQGDLFTPPEQLRKVTINWDSPKQVLNAFRRLYPKLENVNGKELIRLSYVSPLFSEYVKYKEITKRAYAYGDQFIKKYLQPDGRIHTSFFQILNTGRVSSQEPNMQQIPTVYDEKTKSYPYRNAFVPGYKDWVFVSSDYSSQELCVIGVKANDPIWISALENGQDLHSVAAELVFKDKWKNEALDNCPYYKENKQKCKCPGHVKLRTFVKTINFGLAYGMSAHKLSWTLEIPLKDAEKLIKEYFTVFPGIKSFLDALASYGKRFGHIKTFRPFLRRRYFPDHEIAISAGNGGDEFTARKIMGEIGRASMNTPIQGSSADMTKQALVYLHRYLRANPDYPAKLVMTVHDQIDTICHKDVAEEWSAIVTKAMEDAAKLVIPSGLLKAETSISPVWTK